MTRTHISPLDHEPVSGAPPPPARSISLWTRIVLPSVADVIFLALLLTLACGAVSVRLLDDGGTGWHIRNGQQILSAYAIPRVDYFSATMSGKPWYAWEWLFDTGVGAIYNVSGLNGVVFASALAIALNFFLLFLIVRRRGADVAVSSVFVLLAVLASSVHFLARPHVVSWILTILWFAILDSVESGAKVRRTLPWLPFLMLLWVNLHGSFVLGFALLALFGLAAAVGYLRAGTTPQKMCLARRARDLALVTLACGVASLINPYGFRLHLHVYHYLTNRFFMEHIQEFQSPNFHSPAGKAFIILLLISVFALAVRRTGLRLEHALVAAFAAWAGLYASRNLPVASMLLAITAAPLLSLWCEEKLGAVEGRFLWRMRTFWQRMSALDANLKWHVWPALAVVVGLWACVYQGRIGTWQILDAHFDVTRFPVRATDVLADQKVHEPVFSTDAWGGYLIYRLYPEVKVVIDDRHDLYGEAFMRDYLKVLHAEPGWDANLDGWNVYWILLPPQSALSSVLKERRAWRIVYDDGHAIIFHRE